MGNFIIIGTSLRVLVYSDLWHVYASLVCEERENGY